MKKTGWPAKLRGMGDEVASPKISVIVPVYKVEEYLRACVESVLAQTFTDFELILVDDGSPDRSGEICDELAKKDSRIRVFHQQNGGVTSARKLGVEQARGEWINFVDADDLLPKDSLKNLSNEATNDVDWVQGVWISFKNGTVPRTETWADKVVKTFSLLELVEDMLHLHRSPFAKVVRQKLFKPHVMDIPRDIRIGEDALMNLRLIANEPRKAKAISTVVYFYRQQAESACNSSALSESYNFRYARLFFAELEKFPESDRKRVRGSMAHVLCSHAVSTILYGGSIKARRELATLIRPGIGKSLKCLLVWACLRFNFLFLTRLATNTYRRLQGGKLNDKTRKILD